LLALLAACAGDGLVTPPSQAACDGATQQVLSLARYEGTVITGDAVHCTVLAGAGATYLVLPQLTGAALPYGGYGFRIGDPMAAPSVALRTGADLFNESALDARGTDAQALLDERLRTRERTMRPARPRGTPFPSSLRSLQTAARLTGAPLDSLRRFSVLRTLEITPAWAAVDARLRFDGSRVAIYMDTLAAASLNDAELLSMGALYDGALAARMFSTFGNGSDIDGNGKVILLLTPTVNAMVTAAACEASGYVRGFFYGHDLASLESTSNRAEVFYALVPDAAGTWSCPHTKADVLANLPPTFVHELQHMISYGAHVLERGGANEEPWLNEGLSHVAEEMGARYWEEIYPAPTGRTNPAQLLPDSASPYLTPNLLYSYRFLAGSSAFSLLSCMPGSFCSQSERGGVWLFLRWIADQKGEAVLRSLVQTALTGRRNLEAVSGEDTAALLGDFAITASADSIEGVARSRIPARYRLTTRNLRLIYQRLFEAFGFAGGVSRPYPVAAVALTAGSARTGTMRPGTFVTYRLATGNGTPAVQLRFAVPDGSPFPASTGAQVSVFRIE